MIERRKLWAKTKARASYEVVKARRQNKIKSKKYHRILRQERTKKLSKKFEELEKNDPEAALKQLESLERNRAEERATLRHRNSGKWARNQLIKAKYNKESRIALSEQLNKNRELTQKRAESSSDDESSQTSNAELKRDASADPTGGSYAKFVSDYKKFWEEKMPDILGDGGETIDDDNQQVRMLLDEAYVDNDIETEFKQEKENAVERSMPQVEDTGLPGWGSWAGPAQLEKRQTSKAKGPRLNKRLLFKLPKAPPRKDSNKGHVIINEDKNNKLKEHLVPELPHPFVQVKDYEASIRTPIGRTWLPETAHQKLIAPSVLTKLGTVIEPIDEGELIRRDE